jgi:hypothetical protein
LSAEYYKVFIRSWGSRVGDINAKLSNIEKKWLTNNLQNLLDLLTDDYNRKIPSKGMMPRIFGQVLDDSGKGWQGAYFPYEHSLRMYTVRPRQYYRQILNNGDTFINDPAFFASKVEAAEFINTIFHEFVHATQSTLYDNPDPSVISEMSHYIKGKGPEYSAQIVEITAYASDILDWAVVTPRRIYRDETLKRILGFSLAVMQELNIYPSYMWLLGCLRSGVIVEGITEEQLILLAYKKSLTSDKQFEGKYPLVRSFILKNRGSFNVRDEFRRIREGRVSKPLFDKFKKDFEPYIQLHLRNIRRRIHNFQPINEYYGNQNNALYKSDFYGLKL